MSLRHAGKVLFRAAQAVRVKLAPRPMPGAVKPGTAPPPAAAAHRQQQQQQQGGQSSVAVGGLTGSSRAVALETARRKGGRAAEKAENVVRLVCWGPD